MIASTGEAIGKVGRLFFDGSAAKLVGFQVTRPSLIKSFAALSLEDTLSLSRESVIVDSPSALRKDHEPFDTLNRRWGKVLDVPAKTESGRGLGRISDAVIDSQSGLITRFYLVALLKERIIPRQFLVAISPKAVVFSDIVDQPIFNQVAATKTVAA